MKIDAFSTHSSKRNLVSMPDLEMKMEALKIFNHTNVIMGSRFMITWVFLLTWAALFIHHFFIYIKEKPLDHFWPYWSFCGDRDQVKGILSPQNNF